MGEVEIAEHDGGGEGAITAISDFAGPTEDAALREYCANQGV